MTFTEKANDRYFSAFKNNAALDGIKPPRFGQFEPLLMNAL